MEDTFFTFHTDPGHGWLEVDLHEMRRSGLEPKDFSACSYRRRNVFFLEEDCDAPKFKKAYEAGGHKFEYYEQVVPYGQAFVRGMAGFKKVKVPLKTVR